MFKSNSNSSSSGSISRRAFPEVTSAHAASGAIASNAKTMASMTNSSVDALKAIQQDDPSGTVSIEDTFAPPSPVNAGLQRSDSIVNAAESHAAILAKSSVSKDHQQMMLDALARIGALNLLRANRRDVARELGGTTISIAKGIGFLRAKRKMFLPHGTANLSDSNEQKKRFARANGKIYSGTQHCEAYCGEHAYLLLNELLESGMAQDFLVPIVMFAPTADEGQTYNHCALLYCSSKLPGDDQLRGAKLRTHIETNLGGCVVLDAWRKNDKIVVFSKEGDFQKYCESVMREVDPHYHGSGFKVRADPLYL